MHRHKIAKDVVLVGRLMYVYISYLNLSTASLNYKKQVKNVIQFEKIRQAMEPS